MANKQSLREFQQALASRLASARARPAGESMLAFVSGGHRWVLPVAEVAEVVPRGSVVSIPSVKSWFLGMSNVRGALVSVSDLGLFLHSVATSKDVLSRLLVLGGRYQGLRAALLVDQVVGLRSTGLWHDTAVHTHSNRRYEVDGEAEYSELNIRSMIDRGQFLSAVQGDESN